MAQTTNNLIELFIYLLPGLVAASIFYTLTAHPKPNSFERTVQALIFTIIVQALMSGIGKLSDSPAENSNFELGFSVLLAILIGVVFAFFVNYDLLHRFCRWIRITKESSYSSEWHSAFSRRNKNYIVLHLYDGRRVYAWPTEWPSNPEQGHFYLDEAIWIEGELSEIDNKTKSKFEGISLLVPVSDVQLVEFV